MVSPAAFRKLVKEINQLRTEPPEGIRVTTNEENMLDVTGIIAGPEGTPYAGGYFHVRFTFTDEFPAAPPRATMLTKIFHPNVSRQGEICVNTLKKDWKPTYGLGHILVTIKCLLIYPNPESALEEESGKLLLEDWDEFYGRARMWTSVHATPKAPPVEFNTPAASSSKSASPTPSTPAPTVAAPVPTATSPKSKLDTAPTPASLATQSPLQPSAASNTVPQLAAATGKSAAGTENGNAPDVVMKLNQSTPTDPTKKDVPAPSVTKTKRVASGGVEKKKKALKRL